MPTKKKEIILVTGGAGRLGRHIVARLVGDGYEVRVLVQNRDDAARITSGAIPYLGDIADEGAVEKACSGVTTIIHLAAIVSQYRTGSREILRTNALGTRRLARVAKRAGARKIIFASTVNVYGRARKGKLDEKSEPKPTDTYGQSKRLAEKEIMGSGLDYTIFRMATIYGPGFEGSFLKIFKSIKEGKAYVVGRGDNRLALVHINDVVNAFELALQKKRESKNKIYNISDGREYTQKGLFEMAAKMLGVPKPTRHISPILVHIVAKAKGLDTDEIRFITSDRSIDISKARKELGFRPKETAERGASYLLNKLDSPYQKEMVRA